MKVEPEWTGGQREDGGCDRAGSGRAVMACYWRMEGEGEQREQPLAPASERTGGYEQ